MSEHYTLEIDLYTRDGYFQGRTTHGKALAANIGARVQAYLDTLDAGESLILDVTPWQEPDAVDPEPFSIYDYETMRSEK
jgi:hypothetical protein